MNKPNLSPEELLNKKFATELSGYNAEEVDKYLDLILGDYHAYVDEVKKLLLLVEEKNALVNDREQEIDKLNLEIKNIKDQLDEVSKNTNYELVKKIEELTELTKKNTKK